MPELPEVEVVANHLDILVRGRRIERADLLREKLAPDISREVFADELRGRIINRISRRGKHILFELEGGKTLITHLRMSGRFSLFPTELDDPKFTHARFHLDGDSKLVFQDQRHFGLMKVVDTDKLTNTREIAKLAPEPFSDAFSIDYLTTRLRSSNVAIKLFLLDQTKVCGLGNIYSAEALFLAGISPLKAGARLGPKRIGRLHRSIRDVLSESLAIGGTVVVDPTNIGGNFYGTETDAEWLVYDREGLPCPRCSSAIVRIRQNGRSTYYCRKCQR